VTRLRVADVHVVAADHASITVHDTADRARSDRVEEAPRVLAHVLLDVDVRAGPHLFGDVARDRVARANAAATPTARSPSTRTRSAIVSATIVRFSRPRASSS
jgi:hypothetical protein